MTAAAQHEVTLDALRDLGVLPDAPKAVYLSGSVVRGWGNQLSDIDVYAVVDEEWRSETAFSKGVSLDPADVPVEIRYVDGRRWDIEYWLDAQVDQVMQKVAPAAIEKEELDAPSDGEVSLLERLPYCIPLAGEDWVQRRRAELESSAWRAVMTADSLNVLDHYTEDAAGQLEAGDVESAVLSARAALGSAFDGLLASEGEIVQNPKWRARKFRAANPKLLDFERYWQLETMQTFDPDAPEQWVRDVLDTCQMLSTEISVG